eukprot:TRINITY_DN4601_c0_g1_i1.p1 TRINITY_DN4601_c0_g1~~TRINITY_DN4601_c0_g1_i1.p1  ORF type:complete len:392 (-),score=48.72 TRINITY_DN4601_c0_g1_i1:547-1722(-)
MGCAASTAAKPNRAKRRSDQVDASRLKPLTGAPKQATWAPQRSEYQVTTYVADKKGTIIEVRTPEAWKQFAMENDASSIAEAQSVVGHSLYAYMTNPLRDFYALLVEKVSCGTIPVCSFRWFCDTPTIRRELLLVALEEMGKVVFHQCLLTELSHAAGFLSELQYTDDNQSSTILCGICSRFLLAGTWLPAEQFYTAKVQQGCLGIGAVSHKICSQCAGELEEVQCCIPPEATVGPAPQPDQAQSNNGPEEGDPVKTIPLEEVKLVILDDDLVSARVAAHYAKLAGFRPFCCYHPLEALDHMRQNGVDLLATDIVMPEISGIELAERMKKEGISVPVVGMSGSPEYEQACLQVGMIAFMKKPLNREDFGRVLRSAVPSRSTTSPKNSRTPA